ncbi:hypothetical protein [Pontibacter litorisediminis]|uniref:hypothetical protein n=1 Tax=Pontibacter litorisediminis TaxID=1846260 RepID=UPI0023EAD08D|nr:hypothetical protein [Pontibacter litorisediminis]
MKKIGIIALGAMAFACSESADNTATEANTDGPGIEESVEAGAGEEITPQVELDSGDNRRLEVDTISRETTEQQQQ